MKVGPKNCCLGTSTAHATPVVVVRDKRMPLYEERNKLQCSLVIFSLVCVCGGWRIIWKYFC